MKRRNIVLGLCVVATTLLSRTVEWEFPRLGNCHEGMAFADGKTGILAWGGGDTLNLTTGRADLWDHRGGYVWTEEQSYTNIAAAILAGDGAKLSAMFRKVTPPGEPRNPMMLPLGRVVVKIPGAEMKRGELDTSTGLGVICIERDGKSERIEMAMAKSGGGVFALRFPENVEFEVETKSAMEFPSAKKSLTPLGYVAPVKSPDGFTWQIPADKAVTLGVRKSGRELYVATSRGDVEATKCVPQVGFDEIRNASAAYWRKFWQDGARVKLPDPKLQEIFEYGMYRFGAMTDPDGIPAGLQGPWIEDYKLPPWSGDYHFNINVQECYSPAYKGGHFANLRPLFDMVLSWRPLLRDNAKKFAGIDNGYSLPHSVSDRGVNIGGFWTGTIDHGSTAWIADMMWRYVKYSGDVEFLRNGAYDFMKGAMNVYRAMMEEKDGKLAFPIGPSPEFGAANMKAAIGRNPSFQLAAAHALVRDLKSASERLGEKPDAMWLDVEARLPKYVADASGICLWEGIPLSKSHRHHSHMAGMFPFDVFDLDDAGMRGVVDATMNTWDERGTRRWTGWSVPWAAVLNVHAGRPEKAVEMLKIWGDFFLNKGHGSLCYANRPGFTTCINNPDIMQMDGQCAATAAVMELLVHEVNGVPKFFMGCPAEWKEVSFENIALPNGKRVSGRRINGKIEIKEQ